MNYFASELKWAARRLGRAPGSSLAAVSVLALSIASMLTVLAVARAVLLSPLPLVEPEQLVAIERRIGDEATALHSPADLLDLRERGAAFSRLSGSARFRALMTGGAQPTYVSAASVTPEYLETLGATPVLGEIFRADARDRPRDPHAVVVSWTLWQTELGGDRGVLGRSIVIAGEPFRVVAVMPEDLSFLGVDLWIPGPQGLPRPPFPVGPDLLVRRDVAYLEILARVRPGWSLEAARSALDRAGARIAEAYPPSSPEVRFSLVPLKEHIVSGARDHLAVLWGCVFLIFLLGCLSVSGLLLGRGITRSDHDAIKLSLGATRSQMAAAGLAESLLLATAGGALGSLGSIAGVRIFLSLAPPFPRSGQASVDLWLLAAAAGAAMVAALLAGLLPVLRTMKDPPGASSAGLTTRSRKLSWKSLLILEVACMVMLLAVGSVLGSRLLELNRLDLGFSPEGLQVTVLELPRERYPGPDALSGFLQDLMDRLEVLPGAESVGAALPLPLSEARIGGSFSIVGRPSETGEASPSAWFSAVSHGYFRTMGIRVLAGRGFGPDDRKGAPLVAAVNLTLAKRYWNQRSPIGAELIVGQGEAVRVVAVVQDVRHDLTETDVEPRIYRPFLQAPLPAVGVVLRARRPAEHLDAAVREAVGAIDPGQPVPPLVPIEQMLSSRLQPVRYLLLIVGALAGLAVLITGVGLYALLAFTVRQEERHLAVRLALGATHFSLLRLHVSRGLLIAVAGAIVGAIGALAASPVLERVLPGGNEVDPLQVALVGLLAILAAGLSSLVGARRVLRLSPSRVVRET